MKHIFCQVQSNRRNLHLGLLSFLFDGGFNSIVARLTPVRKWEETISSTGS